MEKNFLSVPMVGRGGTPLSVFESKVASELGLSEEAVKSIMRRHRDERVILSLKEDFKEGLTQHHKQVRAVSIISF
jgi:hypothetical protein